MDALMAAEWERFTANTPGSGEHNVRASKSLPLGGTSSFQHWDPYPISVVSARGAWLTDVDGRQLLDLSMGFGAMLVGHLNPTVVEKVKEALEKTGTLFVTPSPTATEVAERYQERFGLDMLRFTQSGIILYEPFESLLISRAILRILNKSLLMVNSSSTGS